MTITPPFAVNDTLWVNNEPNWADRRYAPDKRYQTNGKTDGKTDHHRATAERSLIIPGVLHLKNNMIIILSFFPQSSNPLPINPWQIS